MSKKDDPASSSSSSSSSAAQTTFQQRWTLEEDVKFLQAMRLSSYGKWTRISEIMGGSRTPLQVKNRARHLLMYDVDSPLAIELKALANQIGTSQSHRRVKRNISPKAATTDAAFNTKSLDALLLLSEDEECDGNEDKDILLTAEDILEESIDDDSEETLRSSIIALWESQRPLQLSLEYLFEALPEQNMEAVTALYYLLEEENLINSNTPRKRRVRDEHGNWVEASGEGRTIIHDHQHHQYHSSSSLLKRKRNRKVTMIRDDFELFECLAHTKDSLAPFKVQVSEHVRRVLEIHSLMSKDEVIGLVGGRSQVKSNVNLDDDNECSLIIDISSVFPCSAIEASGIECEMDPISEMQACEYFEQQGVSLIGWYHSHPSFAANPSKRDIETQLMYQSVFTGGFVGLIVRPDEQCSDIVCFHVASDAPFRVHTSTSLSGIDEIEHIKVLQRLFSMYPGVQIERQFHQRLSSLLPNDQCRRAAGLLQQSEFEVVVVEV